MDNLDELSSIISDDIMNLIKNSSLGNFNLPEDINDEDELDLPDKTEMPWYQSGFTEEDDEDDNTQVAIELDDQMEAELNVSEIARA